MPRCDIRLLYASIGDVGCEDVLVAQCDGCHRRPDHQQRHREHAPALVPYAALHAREFLDRGPDPAKRTQALLASNLPGIAANAKSRRETIED